MRGFRRHCFIEFLFASCFVFFLVAFQFVPQSTLARSDSIPAGPTFGQQVVELTNRERVQAGLLPLKEDLKLDSAAESQARAMASIGFFNHINPQTNSNPGIRATAAGYAWLFIAENIAEGQATPEAVVRSWMNSPGHRANILSTSPRETGVGYAYDPGSVNGCGSGSCTHFWAQLFGERQDVYPLIINSDAILTTSPDVSLSLHGAGWAQQMRLKNDTDSFGAWEPFGQTKAWQLKAAEGIHTVKVELRNGAAVLTSTDSIYLQTGGDPAQAAATVTVPTPYPVPPPGLPPRVPDSTTIAESIQPSTLVPGQNALVTIKLTGASILECRGIPTQPLDAIFVFDISESAGNGQNGSNWAKTRDFTHQLLAQLEQPIYRDRSKPELSTLAIVTSKTETTGPQAFLLQDLTQDYGLALKAVDGIVPQGDTNIAEGIRLAKQILDKTPKDRAKAIFLLLHDNDPVTATATKNAAREVGTLYPIYIVANTLNIADERKIKDADVSAMGVDTRRFFTDPGTDQLRDLFLSATNADLNAASLKFRIADEFAPDGLLQLSNISSGGQLASPGKVVWELPRIGKSETLALSYQLSVPISAAGQRVVRHIGAAGIDCNGYLENSVLDEGGQVAPGSPPTPYALIVGTVAPPPSTITPGPSPTPSATSFVLPPGPAATPLPPFTPSAPPSILKQLLLDGGAYCNDWYIWLPPLLLPLLVLLLWFLLSRWRHIDWLYEIKTHRRWCWLPCFLLFIYLFVLAFFVGQALAASMCALPVAAAPLGTGSTALTKTPFAGNSGSNVAPTAVSPIVGAVANISATVGVSGSVNVAILDAANFMPRPRGFSFMDVNASQVTTDVLANYDTVVISQVCDIGAQLSASQKVALVNWVNNGGKLIIYDSDVCGSWGYGIGNSFSVDYSWLPYPFVTDNPGGRGSNSGIFAIVSDDPMMSRDPNSPSYVDASAITRDTEIGDANVMMTRNYAWCGDAQARNVNNQQGFVHAYAFDGRGLIVYNGLDTDDIQYPEMLKIWQHELQQPWDPSGNHLPPGLTCNVRVFGGAVELWPWFLPLIPLLFLCWLLCRRKTVIPQPPLPPPPPLSPPRPGFISQFAPPIIWNPDNALIIGLGGTGRWVLTQLKKNLLDAGGNRMPENVRLLLLDTAESETAGDRQTSIRFAGVELDASEKTVLTEDLNTLIDQIATDGTAEPEIRSWFPAKDYREHLSVVDRDIARGTHSNRPMGRAALVRTIQQDRPETGLFKQLCDNLGAVKEPIEENYRAHVIIVGSLGGGTGSGTINDIAYIVRHAALAAGIKASVAIEAFLVGEGAFRAIPHANPERQRINSFAALREIGRFQLAKDRPYPMQYKDSAPGSVLNGYCTVGLFDNVYLLDTAAYLAGTRPEYGVFPALADVLILLLDPASRSRDYALEKFRETTRSYAVNVQTNRGEAVLGTVGNFVYRLPLPDIVAELRARFGQALIRAYVTSPRYVGTDLPLTAEFNMEETRGFTLEDKAHEVLNWSASLNPPLNEIWPLVDAWEGGQLEELRARAKTFLVTIDKQDPDAFVHARRTLFHDFLADAVLRVLNGREGSTIEQARCGKIGYAPALLEKVEGILAGIASQLRTLESAVIKEQSGQARTLCDVYDAFLAGARELRSELYDMACLVAGGKPNQLGAYEILRLREQDRRMQRAEMAKIESRRYLVSDDLIDQIYHDYLNPLVDQHYDRFYWQVTDENGQRRVRLNFVTWEDNLVSPGNSNARVLADHLEELAGVLLKGLWDRKDMLLAEILSRELLNADHLQATEKAMCERAVPLAPIEPTLAPPETPQAVNVIPNQYQTKYFVNVNANVSEAETLRRKVEESLQGPRVEVVPITEPLTCGLLSITEVVPVSAFLLRKQANDTYRWAFGISESGAQGQIGWREPAHVFPAEQNALVLEQRMMRDLEMPSRISNPLFVAALENHARARIFALAVLGGLVRREMLPQSDNKYRYRLYLSNQSVDVALALPEDITKIEAPLVVAMRTFVLGLPLNDPAHIRSNLDELGHAVEMELEHDDVALADRLGRLDAARFVLPDSAREDATREAVPLYAWEEQERPGGIEIVAFLRLVAMDELAARRARNTNRPGSR
ncbi:MAG: CAP domain-containing protein [Chloroflexi bacterium]|nr:CAP domain-containing protein [Chloroflexota bacterium]